MGLLDQLWDDTLAGPTPETGLGKLRKRPTFWTRSGRNGGERPATATAAAAAEEEEEEPRVTRRPEGGTPLISPAGSTPPVSPFSAESSFRGDQVGEEGRNGTGSGGNPHQTRTTRDQQGWWEWDPELLLLMRCELC
ncbi:uncharacterized protein M6B38_140765 [Iris pallida]|uniref:Dormancy-associated protein homolog 3 n=1 Tax=Iris pallida TaxID=29817 RepID=A0AAX6FDT8_IRIPA|nr:uncharacterized protein M6B38_140765 [Iris pallida]